MGCIGLAKAKALLPLPGKPTPHQNRTSATCTDGKPEETMHLQAAE